MVATGRREAPGVACEALGRGSGAASSTARGTTRPGATGPPTGPTARGSPRPPTTQRCGSQDADSGLTLHVLPGARPRPIVSVTSSPDERRLLYSTSRDGAARVPQRGDRHHPGRDAPAKPALTSALFSHDGTQVAAWSVNGRRRALWDLTSGHRRRASAPGPLRSRRHPSGTQVAIDLDGKSVPFTTCPRIDTSEDYEVESGHPGCVAFLGDGGGRRGFDDGAAGPPLRRRDRRLIRSWIGIRARVQAHRRRRQRPARRLRHFGKNRTVGTAEGADLEGRHGSAPAARMSRPPLPHPCGPPSSAGSSRRGGSGIGEPVVVDLDQDQAEVD